MKSKVIVCKEIKYAEFPDLLTGADQELSLIHISEPTRP